MGNINYTSGVIKNPKRNGSENYNVCMQVEKNEQ